MIKQKIEVNDEFDEIIELQEKLFKIIESNMKEEEDIDEIRQNYLTDRIYFSQLLKTLAAIIRARPLLLSNVIDFISSISEQIKQFFTTSEIIFYFSFNLSAIYHLLSIQLITFEDLMNESIYRSINFFVFFIPEIETNDNFYYSNTFNNSYYMKIFRQNNNNESIEKKRKSGMNETRLARIIATDDVEALQSMISKENMDLNYQIQKSDFETNEFLKKLKTRITMIEYSAFLGSVTIFKFLLLSGAYLHPFIAELATAGGNADIIHMLEQHHIKFNQSCLGASIVCHRNELFEYIHSNYDVHFTSHHLLLSVKFYNFFCFNLILSENPSFLSENVTFLPDMLEQACITGNLEVFSFLAKFVDASQYKNSKHDLFTLSCLSGFVEIVRHLLNMNEIDKNFVNSNLENPLHKASLNGHLDVVKLLVNSHLYQLNQPTKMNETALHYAVNRGHYNIVKFFINDCKDEININCISKAWMTPLMLAAEKGFYNIVVLLCSSEKVDLNCKDFMGRTALHIAALNGYTQIVSFLINLNGIELNSPDKNGSTPLHLAAQADKVDIIKILVEKNGVNLHLRDQAIFFFFCKFLMEFLSLFVFIIMSFMQLQQKIQ